jgi:hypothetical protein
VKTPVFTRFSTVTLGREFPDVARNPRGFAIKFYTGEGNYDIVGLNWVSLTSIVYMVDHELTVYSLSSSVETQSRVQMSSDLSHETLTTSYSTMIHSSIFLRLLQKPTTLV